MVSDTRYCEPWVWWETTVLGGWMGWGRGCFLKLLRILLLWLWYNDDSVLWIRRSDLDHLHSFCNWCHVFCSNFKTFSVIFLFYSIFWSAFVNVMYFSFLGFRCDVFVVTFFRLLFFCRDAFVVTFLMCRFRCDVLVVTVLLWRFCCVSVLFIFRVSVLSWRFRCDVSSLCFCFIDALQVECAERHLTVTEILVKQKSSSHHHFAIFH